MRCPVHLLQVALRPASCKTTGPLFLTPKRKLLTNVWYIIVPVGINTINTFMQAIAKARGLECTGKRLTNDSVRKTTIKKLTKYGVTNTNIAAITGHRNEQSLQQYAEMENVEHSLISKVLSGELKKQIPLQPLQAACVQQGSAVGALQVPHYHFFNCTVHFEAKNIMPEKLCRKWICGQSRIIYHITCTV